MNVVTGTQKPRETLARRPALYPIGSEILRDVAPTLACQRSICQKTRPPLYVAWEKHVVAEPLIIALLHPDTEQMCTETPPVLLWPWPAAQTT